MRNYTTQPQLGYEGQPEVVQGDGGGEGYYFLMTNVWVCPLDELDVTVTSLPFFIDS